MSPDQTEVWNAKIAVRRSPGAQEERSSSALLTNCSSTLNQNCAAKLMVILLYCIAKRDVQVRTSLTGVAGDPVVRAETGPLATFTSHNTDSAVWLRSELKASAIEFHRVLSEVFKSSAIIPFRFPTIFESEEQLAKHLQERSSEYNGLLEKFSDMVQMEIRLTHPGLGTLSGSGTEYLKERQ